MANDIHSQITDQDELHIPKGFTEASNETALVKGSSGNLEYRDLSQLGDTGPQGPAGTITAEQERGIFNGISTGLVQGGTISINGGDSAKFDVSAGSGWVVDSHTDGKNPTRVFVEWSAFIAQIVTNLATEDVTHVAINSSGALVQQTSIFTQSQLRDFINIGAITHPDNIQIISTVGTPIPGFNSTLNLEDLAETLGPTINKSGNVYSANGANLQLDKTGGETFRLGLNFSLDTKSPNIFIDSAEVPIVSLFGRIRNGFGGFKPDTTRSIVNPNNFDNGSGTLASVATNKFTIQRFYFGSSSTADTLFQYGQVEYNSLSDAEAAIFSDPFVTDPILIQDTTFRAFLIIKQGATDLSDLTLAKFIEVQDITGASSTAVSTDLQSAYNNGLEPEITTNSIRGAVNIQEGAGVGGSLFTCQDENGTSGTVLDVTTTEIKAEKQVYSPTDTLADIASITSDMETGNVKTVTLGGNRTLANPTNLKDGATYIWIIKQDATGNRTLAYGSAFKFENGIAPILSAGANDVDILSAVSDGVNVFAQLIKDFS